MALRPIKVVIAGVDKFSSTLGKVSKDLQTVGNTAKDIGGKMTVGVTAPVIFAGVSVLKTAADFQMAMNRVRALTGATGEEFQALSLKARDLGKVTQFTATDAANAMGYLGIAGFKTSEILGAMPSVLTLAASANIDLATASSIVTDTLRGFGLQISELPHMNDVLVKTFTSSNQTLEDLGEAFSYVGNVASQSGLKFEETAAALGILASHGIRATRGGTALREILGKILVPASEAVEVLNRLGIPKASVITSSGQLKSLTALINQLGKHGAKTSDVLTIFGERAGPGMLALMKGGTAEIQRFQKMLDDAGGTAVKVGAVQMSGLTGKIKFLTSSFQELELRIADSGLIEWASSAVLWVTKIVERIMAFSPALLRVIVISAGVAAALGPVLYIIGTMITGIASFATLWPAIVAVVTAAASAIGAVIATVSAPVLAIGAAVAVVVIGLIAFARHSKTLGSIWAKLLPFFRLIGLVIGKVLSGALSLLGGAFQALWIICKAVLGGIGELLDVLLKPLDMLLGLITKLASLAMPDWLKAKIGLDAQVTQVAAGTSEIAQKAAGGNAGKGEVHVKFDNAPKGTRIETKTGPGFMLSTELGMGY